MNPLSVAHELMPENFDIRIDSGVLKAEEPVCGICRYSPYPTSCSCSARRKKIRLFNQARIPARFISATLDSIRPCYHPDHTLTKLYHWIAEWLERKPLPKEGILISGPCGIGKSHAMAALARHLTLSRSVSCLFLDWKNFLTELKSTFNGNVTLTECLLPVRRAEVIILDDIGAERGTQWEKLMFDEVISIRYNAFLPTFITTNIQIYEKSFDNELEKTFPPHTTSRIAELCYRISLKGEDRRKSRTHHLAAR